MQSNKTHAHHLKIVEQWQGTGNTGSDVHMNAYLSRSATAGNAFAEGKRLQGGLRDIAQDRAIIGAESQRDKHSDN